MIRPADKGGGIVVLSQEQYKTEMNRILEDKNTYQVLKSDPSRQFKAELESVIVYGKDKELLNKHEEKYLVPTASRIPVIYYLPKIHKDKINPPGRPIVSGIESLTSRLGEYIDIHIQPLVRNTQAFLQDTKHTLQLLKGCMVSQNMVMATGDVALLYTNIDHKGGHEVS